MPVETLIAFRISAPSVEVAFEIRYGDRVWLGDDSGRIRQKISPDCGVDTVRAVGNGQALNSAAVVASTPAREPRHVSFGGARRWVAAAEQRAKRGERLARFMAGLAHVAAGVRA